MKIKEFTKSSMFRFTTVLLVPLAMVQMTFMMKAAANQTRHLDRSITPRAASVHEQSTKFLPLVLVFEGGCSASTAVGRFIEKIIIAHNLQRYDRVGFEFMDIRGKKARYKNPVYYELVNKTEYVNSTADEILLDSVEIAKKEAEELGQLFYFKAHNPKVKRENRKRMDEIGVVYAGVYRHNVLDRCICTTKDCFATAAGYPVYQHNGTKASACFDRRKEDLPVLTHFVDPTSCLEHSFKQQKRIKKEDFPSVSQESLFEFEYTDSDEAFNRSKDAWMKLLGAFLSTALDERNVIKVLKEYRGSRSLPKPHKELVSNYDDFMTEIKGTKWERYLREA